MSVLLAGGGINSGMVIGETDRLGQAPKNRPVTPLELHATLYKILGIDPGLTLTDHSGRPVSPLEQARPIHELLS